MVDECMNVLTEVGPTVLTIDPLTHQSCGAGGGEGVGAYLACVTNTSDWKISADQIDLTQAAAKSECTEYGSEFKWDSKTGNCKLGSRTVEEIRASGEWELSLPTSGRQIFTHKGKTYTASRACKPPRRMVWTTYPSFLGIGGKVEEAGCMTQLELEAFNREQRLRRESRPVVINNPAPITQPSGGGMIVPMYQKPINCTGVNYGGAGFSATCN